MSIKRNGNDVLFYIAMVAPAFLFFTLIIAGPIVFSLGLSFTNFDLKPNQVVNFVWFDNFIKMFQDAKFHTAFKNNMIVVAVSVFGQIPLGLALAYFLHRGMVRFKHFFQAMVFMPQVISTVVVGILFRNFFGIRGAATALVRWIIQDPKFNFTWFVNPSTAMVPVAIALIWIYTGYFMLIFLANMQKLDPGIIEAAQIDGANEFQIFFRIITPAMAGVIVVNSILAISGSLKGFDLIYALAPNEGQGLANANLVLPTYMYHYGFLSRKYAFGSAVSTIIVSISLIFIAIASWVGKKLNPLGEE